MCPTRLCRRCGAQLPTGHGADRPCPRCLYSLALEDSGPGDPSGEAPPTPAELAPHFPQLEIDGLIGRGGGGSVYRARQRKLDRPVALKILSAEASSDPAFAERFEREAKALASLSHPHITAVYDFGEAGGHYYLLMELVDGVDLRQLIRSRELAPAAALKLVSQICEALEFAHERGVVHRDIKPENVLVDRAGSVKIVDFGLAKILGQAPTAVLTRSDQAMGTWHYMAPEQIERPLEVDHRADIFSLGVVLYELLTGELPLGRFEPPSRKVEVDVRLDDVVAKALAKEPDRRYQHASEVQTEVDTISTSRARRAGSGRAERRARRREHAAREPRSSTHKIVLTVLAVLLGIPLAMGCLGCFGVLLYRGSSVQRVATLEREALRAELEAASQTTSPGQLVALSELQQLVWTGRYDAVLRDLDVAAMRKLIRGAAERYEERRAAAGDLTDEERAAELDPMRESIVRTAGLLFEALLASGETGAATELALVARTLDDREWVHRALERHAERVGYRWDRAGRVARPAPEARGDGGPGASDGGDADAGERGDAGASGAAPRGDAAGLGYLEAPPSPDGSAPEGSAPR